MSTAVAPTGLERLYPLSELSSMGYGSRRANLNRINAGEIPAVKVGNTYKIRERDLHLLAEPAGAATSVVSDPAELASLGSLISTLVSTWPRLSDDRKRELGALLATP